MSRTFFIFLYLIAIIFSDIHSFAEAKPFKRALIISGGGMVPGLGLGYIAGAEEMGWKPDIIIATCGGSLPTVMYDKFGTAISSLEFMKSQEFFNAYSKVRVQTSNLLTLQDKFSYLREKPNLIPDFFTQVALYVPSYYHPILANHHFKAEESKSRSIILTARAHFHKQDVGQPKDGLMNFTQVFMTDKNTASYLTNYQSPLKSLYPESNIESKTDIMTYMSAEVAMRASVSDPILMEPLLYGSDYYFTGASDLYPIELAHFLADEVVATYPMGVFSEFEDLAFKSTFGISQQQRALAVIKDQSIKWIDQTDFPKDMSFDPTPTFLFLNSGIPTDLESFQDGIDRQFEFGRERMIEALSIKQGQDDYLKHIRSPINRPDSSKKSGSGMSYIF